MPQLRVTLSALALAVFMVTVVVGVHSDCEAPTAAAAAVAGARCSPAEIRRCSRAATAAGGDLFSRRCQRRRRQQPRWCRCCARPECRLQSAEFVLDDSAKNANKNRGNKSAAGDVNSRRHRVTARRRLRRQVRQLVRRLGGGADSPEELAATSRRRNRLMQRLLDLELRLLSLRKNGTGKASKSARRQRGESVRDESSRPRSRSKVRSDDKAARWKAKRTNDKDESADRPASWSAGSLEQLYFVGNPMEDTDEKAKARHFPNASLSPTSNDSYSDTLEWLSHLEEQRTGKVKAACSRVSCNRARGELCLANIQDLPVCRCVTSVNCINERRRLRERSAKRRRRRLRHRQLRRSRRDDQPTGSVNLLARQFSGRVCAQLSGLPAERTYPSLCHMHAAACSSDSQVLRLSEGACSNHDPESEALETLTDQKCARCLGHAWRGRGCKKWRDRCHGRS